MRTGLKSHEWESVVKASLLWNFLQDYARLRADYSGRMRNLNLLSEIVDAVRLKRSVQAPDLAPSHLFFQNKCSFSGAPKVCVIYNKKPSSYVGEAGTDKSELFARRKD